MPFDCYADNHSVPPKSRCPLEARESLPQSFHSLAASEPDPITLFTPYNFICALPQQRACQQFHISVLTGLLRRISPTKPAEIFFAAPRPDSKDQRLRPLSLYPFNTFRREFERLHYTGGFNLSAGLCSAVHSSPREFKRRSNFADNLAPVIIDREA